MAVAQRSNAIEDVRLPRPSSSSSPSVASVSDEQQHAPSSASNERLVSVAAPPDKRPDLLATIESEIIPRLMLAHRADPLSPTLCSTKRRVGCERCAERTR